MTTPISSTIQPDVVLIGAGIMSATLAVILKELDPQLKIVMYEVLGSEALESSNAWNNAGTGHGWNAARGRSQNCERRPIGSKHLEDSPQQR
jgi:L-2-hydroxyglutarate oxidase LhgO